MEFRARFGDKILAESLVREFVCNDVERLPKFQWNYTPDTLYSIAITDDLTYDPYVLYLAANIPRPTLKNADILMDYQRPTVLPDGHEHGYCIYIYEQIGPLPAEKVRDRFNFSFIDFENDYHLEAEAVLRFFIKGTE